MFGYKLVREKEYKKLVEEIIPSVRRDKIVIGNQKEIDLSNEIKVLEHRLKEMSVAMLDYKDKVGELKKELNTMDAKTVKAVRLYDDFSKIIIDTFGVDK